MVWIMLEHYRDYEYSDSSVVAVRSHDVQFSAQFVVDTMIHHGLKFQDDEEMYSYSLQVWDCGHQIEAYNISNSGQVEGLL